MFESVCYRMSITLQGINKYVKICKSRFWICVVSFIDFITNCGFWGMTIWNTKHILWMWDLQLSHWHFWWSVLLGNYVIGWAVPHVLKNDHAFIFKGWVLQEDWQLKMKTFCILKLQESLIRWHITFPRRPAFLYFVGLFVRSLPMTVCCIV